MKNKNYTLIPNQLIRSQGLTTHEKVVYMVLKSFNPSYPSQKVISSLCGISVTSVKTALKGLRRKNLISWKKGNSFKGANFYYFTMSAEWRLPRRLLPTNKTKRKEFEDDEIARQEYMDRMIRDADLIQENYEQEYVSYLDDE